MSWMLLYVPDMILIPIFIYLLVVIYRSKYDVHHTPFYSFLISSGMCGIASVATHFFYSQVSYSADQYWILQIILIINENGTFGATIGKFYIALHRYCVMRQVVVHEKIWSSTLVRFLILIQFFLPTASSIFFVLPDFSDMTVVDGKAFLSVENKALQYVNLSVFSFYCVACLPLTYLSIRRLSSLGRILEGNSRQTVLKQQYNFLMIVTVCCISHILKALQQFSVLIISYYQLDPQTYLAIIWPTYVLTNGLATYSPAVILVLRSAKIRSLFLGWIRPLHLTSSSTQTVAPKRIT